MQPTLRSRVVLLHMLEVFFLTLEQSWSKLYTDLQLDLVHVYARDDYMCIRVLLQCSWYNNPIHCFVLLAVLFISSFETTYSSIFMVESMHLYG